MPMRREQIPAAKDDSRNFFERQLF